MFYADLHIHSKYSRATSKNCDLENLALWGAKKGLSIISTGDFTHPIYFDEIKEKLKYLGDGVFKLKDEIENEVFKNYPKLTPPKFLLSVEISTIYKRFDKTRKVHHVVFCPDIESASKFRNRLDKIGNIKSDGRPILGITSRNLLEIALEASNDSYIIPAHIWTPWFSALGSKSGYDSIEDCYEDLSDHIFALETGLSSDPYMNWRVSKLDKYRLVSNSDAHSPSKLAREATVFDFNPDYFSLKNALMTGKGYVGTVEFFPEEGKYHFDGHRKCGVCLESFETKKLKGICPVCSKPLTIGVSYRVEELADRKEGEFIPKTGGVVFSLIPLVEIISEIFELGVASKKVETEYERLISKFGSELDILQKIETDKLKQDSTVLAEAINRLRNEKVIKTPGYDGEYGAIKLFNPGEVKDFYNLKLGLDLKIENKKTEKKKYTPLKEEISKKAKDETKKQEDIFQKEAIESDASKLLIVAGPGSGKTTVLTKKIAYLIKNNLIEAKNCLALTFTKKAAEELSERLGKILGKETFINVHTFHSLCFKILKEKGDILGLKPDFQIITKEEKLLYKDDEKIENALDFEDLIKLTIELLEKNKEVLDEYIQLFKYIFVDEYQDIDSRQYQLIKLLTSKNIFAIGDNNQAIYGFRGGSARFFNNFSIDYPDSKKIILKNNYRSSKYITDASNDLINSYNSISKYDKVNEKTVIYKAYTKASEAEFIVSKIENLIGGGSFFSLDSNRAQGFENEQNYTFSDFAILYRSKSCLKPLKEALDRISMPYASYSEDALCSSKPIRELLSSIDDNSPIDSQIKALKHKYITEVEENVLDHLINLAEKFPNRYDFYHEAAFLNMVDTYDKNADRISLMTLHSSKGLEFKCVFIFGCEEGLIPFRLAKTKEEIEEEKRLLYVGMTRAKDRLFISYSENGKEENHTKKSRFLDKINPEFLLFEEVDKIYRTNNPKQLKLF